jgi:hypothetical protein
MMKMLGSIWNGLKSALMAIGRAATWPLRAVFGGGGGAVEPPEIADLAGSPDPVADREKAMTLGAAMAEAILAWAANSVIDDASARIPDGLTDDLKSWARGLSREECETVLRAEEHAISAHIQGVFVLPGVRKVQPLPTTSDWGHARTRDRVLEPALSDEPAVLAP